MQKDLKIGMVLGLVLVPIAIIWLSTRPSLSTKARMLRSHSAAASQETPALPNNLSTNGFTAENNQLSIINNQSKLPDFTVHYKSEKINPVRNSIARYNMIQKGKISNGVKTQKFHIVRKGETLSDISYKHYGSANKWQKILDANRLRLKDADTLKPGTKLTIPE